MIPIRNMLLTNGDTVDQLLTRQPWLHLIESNVFDIPRRLREYDLGFFVVRNILRNRTEIHHIDNIGSTYCMTVNYPQLDARVFNDIRKGDVKIRGDEVLEDIFNEEIKHEMEKEKETKSLASDIASDVGGLLRKAIQGGCYDI